MRTLLPALGAALLIALPAGAATDPAASDEPADFQVFLGVLELDDQTGRWDEISNEPVDVDFSTLPSGGIEAEYVFYRGWVHAGLNPGGSLAWKNDDTSISGGFTEQTGGVLAVELDNSLFLFEMHLGAYVRGRLHERVTAYAAAGPMIMYGHHDVEDERVDPDEELDLPETSASDINLGYYARAGIDFDIGGERNMGLGVRYLSTELDFDDTVGNIDIAGPQYVLTFSQRL